MYVKEGYIQGWLLLVVSILCMCTQHSILKFDTVKMLCCVRVLFCVGHQKLLFTQAKLNTSTK